MKGKYLWMMISHILGTATAVFFHDISFDINANVAEKGNYFGYSLSYQKKQNNLVVGAPNDVTGKVFTCPLEFNSTENFFKSVCTRYGKIKETINNLPHTKRYADDQKFMLGTSVAALPNSSFVTCAPMWSGVFEKEFHVWGACVQVNNNGEVKELNGIYGPERKQQSLLGNFGLRMYSDDVNDIILISKPASPSAKGDIVYIKQTDPLNSMNSLIESNDIHIISEAKNTYKSDLSSKRNLGIAMASGNYFKKKNGVKTIYAIGVTDQYADGEVVFLTLQDDELSLLYKNEMILQIKYDDTKFSMLGASLCNVTLDKDDYTDLLVGAPAQTDRQKTEYGAVHVHLGSYDADDFVKRRLTIMGKKEGSRFGSTISADDLDGDGLSEIFISALYEGTGVLYILSGYEMKEKLDECPARPNINVTDFKSRQEIHKSDDYKLLGFSILPLPDLDNNGCDELAVGAPESGRIMIFRCIPTIKITVTAEIKNYEVVPETVTDFQVSVCIDLEYQSKMENIAAKVNMANTVDKVGVVTINDTDKTLTFDLSKKYPRYCQDVHLHIEGWLPGSYKFQTQAKLTSIESDKTTFDRSWVRNSSYSVMNKLLIIQRACRDSECDYNMTIDFKWSRGVIDRTLVPAGIYAVGWANNETMTLRVTNWGRPAYYACVLITVKHASVSELSCKVTHEGYKCMLPTGFMPKKERDIDIVLAMSKLTDEYSSFSIEAVLYNECDVKDTNQTFKVIIDYKFNADDLSVAGSSSTRSITEKSIKTTAETIDVIHTYVIENNGSVLWKNVLLDVVAAKEIKDFVRDLKVHSTACSFDQPNFTHCTFEPLSTTKVVVTLSLKKKEIEKSLMANNLKVISELTLRPKSVTVMKQARVVAVILFEKDSSLGQNQTMIILIAVIVALIILAIIIFVLYKIGFFKRKQKEEIQEEIRRRSTRRSNATSLRNDSLVEIMEEDMADDAFHCDDDILANRSSTSNNRHSTRALKRSFSKETNKPE